ncbi:MAG: carbon dioxide-concentrating mechanism protein CcmK [Pleurocapsa sp.]
MANLEYRRTPADKRQYQPEHPFKDSALGLVSTKSFPAIVGIADQMLKSAEVTLVGYEKIGSGHCTAVVRGNIADVRLAVEEGSKIAIQFGGLLSKLVLARPMPNLEAVFPIGSQLIELAQKRRGYSRLSNRSIGLLETRGFPAMVGAADAMLKSADVQLASYEKIGDGLCTAIIRGSVANVAVAMDAGMHEAERIGELHSMMIIPRLLEDLEHTLPVSSYWLDEVEPLPVLLPNKVEEKEKELIELPQAETKPISIPLKRKRIMEIEEL